MAIKLSDIKSEIAKSGTNKGKFFFLKDGSKARVRFLTDLEDGVEVIFHDSYEKNINVPCQELFGRDCPYCEDDELRTRKMYAWCVYEYESKEVKIMMFAINSFTPVPSLTAAYESYGTLLDRDYEIKRMGSGTSTTYSVLPMDKMKFRNARVKAMSEQAILKAIDKAYPSDLTEEEDDDEETRKPAKKTKGKKAPINPPEEDEEESEDGDDWEEDDETPDYESMSAKELYKLCQEKEIDCKMKMSKQYYIDLLEDGDDW